MLREIKNNTTRFATNEEREKLCLLLTDSFVKQTPLETTKETKDELYLDYFKNLIIFFVETEVINNEKISFFVGLDLFPSTDINQETGKEETLVATCFNRFLVCDNGEIILITDEDEELAKTKSIEEYINIMGIPTL